MAREVIHDSQLRMEYNVGIDSNGNPIYKYKNYNNLKTSATPDAIQTVSMALAALQRHTLTSIQRNNTYEIEAE